MNPDGCVGHLCGSEVKLTDPEGGHVILEYIYFDTELQTALGITPTAARIIAFFMNTQTPNANPLPTPGVCNNLVATRGWPVTIGTPRMDLDVGTVTVTGKNGAGADVTIPIDKQPMGLDQFGRPHDIFYQTVKPNVTDFLKPDSAYTVDFGGAGTIPATSFNDNIFLAQDFQISEPALEDNGPLVAGTDFTVKWTPATSANLPAGDEILGVTWLVDATGAPTHMCPTLHSAGTFTIPGTAITEYKAIAQARGLPQNKMILLRNAIVHKLARLPNGEAENQRRVDMLSVMCWAQLMDVQ
jgi:hypothetical protein